MIQSIPAFGGHYIEIIPNEQRQMSLKSLGKSAAIGALFD